MTKKKEVSSLLSSEATGGDTAQRGFKYQANLIVARIPNWLIDDGFTELIVEALGDVEAKFFRPSIGVSREFIEYKNHSLPPSEFWSEISHFQEMDQAAPGAYHRFVLASKGLSDSLKPIPNGLRRVRDAYHFYDGVHHIQAESFSDFVIRVGKAGKNKDIADFIYRKVWFETDLIDAEEHPRELFREALIRHFPIFEEISVKRSNTAYSELVRLINSRLNQPILRSEIEAELWRSVEPNNRTTPILRMHTIYGRNQDAVLEGSLTFDWERFFGGLERKNPPANEWNDELVTQLQATKDWIISTNRSRSIRLDGNRRLSASFAMGAVFSSTSGFAIEMETKDGLWATNNYPMPATPEFIWETELIDGDDGGEEIAIGIGIKRRIKPEVETYIKASDFKGSRLHLFCEHALLSDDHANHAVDQAKNIILGNLGLYNRKRIRLFLATPAQFALFLGHRLNATCLIQCYERTKPNMYVPTCRIQMS